MSVYDLSRGFLDLIKKYDKNFTTESPDVVPPAYSNQFAIFARLVERTLIMKIDPNLTELLEGLRGHLKHASKIRGMAELTSVESLGMEWESLVSELCGFTERFCQLTGATVSGGGSGRSSRGGDGSDGSLALLLPCPGGQVRSVEGGSRVGRWLANLDGLFRKFTRSGE